MQLPLFEPTSTWKVPNIADLPSWKGKQRICIDIETRDDTLKELGPGVRRGAYIVGVGFTIEDTKQTFYLPMRHAGGGNLPEDQVLRYLKENAAVFDGQLVGANLSYDLDFLWEEGILFPNIKFYRDIQVADPLIYELHDSFSLENIGKRFKIPAKREDELRAAALEYKIDPKKHLWKLPAQHVGFYAEQDTISPLLILREQEKLIEQFDLWSIWNLESKVLPILLKMQRRGVRIDQNKLKHIDDWSLAEETKALAIVKQHTDYDVGLGNIWKAEALVPALKAIGMKIGQTKTGKPNIDADILDGIDHPVGKALARARKVNKLRTTFGESIRKHMTQGRIHCTFNQIAREDADGGIKGARFGRLSCVKPNLQQQPSRDEFASMWRSIYIPEEGALWVSNDYSQQEPRWTTHFAALMNLKGAKEAAKRYRDDPKTDNHTMMAELTGLPRKQAKDIFLGLCYGEGGAKLCRDLNLPTRWAVTFVGDNRRREVKHYETKEDALHARFNYEGEAYYWEAAGTEGQNIIDTFDARVPYVRLLAREAEKRAKETGRIRTVGGRLLHFPQKENGSYDWTHKALNRLIQGSSADQTKTALVAIDTEMPEVFLQLQVHDELTSSCASIQEAQGVSKLMRECISDTLVPFRVDIEVGPSWGEAKDEAA